MKIKHPATGKQLEVVTLDFETYFAQDYTLRSNAQCKMNTSEYVRSEQFKAQCCGFKLGAEKAFCVPGDMIKDVLATINWGNAALLCHNCVPEDTEILTPSGWKRIAEAANDETLMQWNPETETLSWTKPLAKVSKKSSKLLTWDTNYHQGSYTPNHRVYFSTPDNIVWRAESAQQVASKSQNNTYVPTAGYFAGGSIDLLSCEAQFMEAVRADGSWAITNGEVYGVNFHFKKSRKIHRLLEVIEILDLPYRVTETELGATRVSITTCDLVRKLFSLLGQEKKYGPWVIDLPLHARKAILHEAQFWDGSQVGVKRYTTYAFSTADKETAEAFQLMAHTSGWGFNYTERDNARGFNAHNKEAKLYTGQPRERSYAKLVSSPVEEDGDFDVYCYTVPTSAFLIRRNGVVSITGNCAFDGLILSHHYGVVPAFYLDSLSMARALHSNEIRAGLDDVAKFYNVGNKMQDVLGKTKGIRDLPDDLLYPLMAYCQEDVRLTYDIFKLMVKDFPVDELELIDITIAAFCDPVLKIDVPRCQKELAREVAHKKAVLKKATGTDDYERAKEYLGKNEWLAQALIDVGVTPPMKYSIKQEKMVYAFAKGDEAFVELMDDEDSDAAALVEARLAVKSSIGETRAGRLLAMQEKKEWCAPVLYNYYGAHTGRWSGGNKTNFQNFKRGGELRKCILAPKGYAIVTGDSAQIEARMNAWFWGHDEITEAFSNGDDIYCMQAEGIYGVETVKGRSDDDDERRQIGKVAILALGYQGANNAFNSMARNYGVRLPEDQVGEIVRGWRKANKPIVEGWAALQNMLKAMLAGQSGEVGVGMKLQFEPGIIWLPNGLSLKYPDLQASFDKNGRMHEITYSARGGRVKIYGGKCNENIIQALARIVVGEQIIQINRRYRTTMTTHDEGSWLAQLKQADNAAKWIEEQMSVAPDWAPGLPVASDVKWGAYYSK